MTPSIPQVAPEVPQTESLLAALRELGPRPFEQVVVQSPWSTVVDAPATRGEIKDRLRAVVANAGLPGDVSRCATILGGPGQGKTHLLAWIRQVMDEQNRGLFVYIPPAVADGLPLPQHLVRATVDSLLSRSTRNQERFCDAVHSLLVQAYDDLVMGRGGHRRDLRLPWNLLAVFWRRIQCIGPRKRYEQRLALQRAFRSRGFFEYAFQKFAENIRAEGKGVRPDLEAFIAAALVTCGNTQQRWYAERWFRNEFDPREVREPYHLVQPCQSSEKVRDTLFTLQRLVEQPFILAFDQMEETFESYLAAGHATRIVSHLSWVVDSFFTLPGFAQLYAMQRTYWVGERFTTLVEKQIRTRMVADGGLLDLTFLTPEIAGQIVRSRMEKLAWAELTGVSCPPEQPYFPFTEAEIQQLRRDANGELRTFLEKVREAYLTKLRIPGDDVIAQPPVKSRVHSVYPVEALSHESTRVTLRGECLPLAVEVFFGDAPAQHITTHPDKNTIEVTTPTGLVGEVPVRVVNADSKQEVGQLHFAFLDKPLPPLCERIDRARLRSHREALKLTQAQVARRLGTTQTRVSAFERGIVGLDDHELELMAQLFGQTIQEFLRRDGT